MAGLAIAHVPVKEGQAIARIGRVPGRTVSGTVPDGPAALPRPPPLPPQGSRCGFPSRARAIPDPDSPYHLRGLQTRSHHAVPLDHRPKLSVTSCVKAAEVQRGRGVSPRSPSPPRGSGQTPGRGGYALRGPPSSRPGSRARPLAVPGPGEGVRGHRVGHTSRPSASSLTDPDAWDSTDRGSRSDPNTLR